MRWQVGTYKFFNTHIFHGGWVKQVLDKIMTLCGMEKNCRANNYIHNCLKISFWVTDIHI